MSVVGARPQFIKAALVSRALKTVDCREYLVHTGQHYDPQMSAVFFEDLELAAPFINLGVGSGTHGWQTAEILRRLESPILELRPDLVLVYGDTNSTLAAALAAVKLQVPVAHVEAGARNFSLSIPEEVNRVLADRLSALRFCATRTSVTNLEREGIREGVILTGDVLLDMFQKYEAQARQRVSILRQFGLREGEYVLATLHRPSNVDDPKTLRKVLNGLTRCGRPVIFPVHPRTQRVIDQLPTEYRAQLRTTVILTEPVGYLDMVCLELFCHCVVTDSGGLQREAYFAGKPCVTIFPHTPWPETVEEGWNTLASPDAHVIAEAIQHVRIPQQPRRAFGDGRAAQITAQAIRKSIEIGLTVDGCNLEPVTAACRELGLNV